LKRDGGGYRSTFTSACPPSLAKGNQPLDNRREMEVMANRGFLSYLRQYLDYGVLSGYCWESDDDALGIGVFLRKDPEAAMRVTISDAISCGDVCDFRTVSRRKRKFHYLLASSAIVSVTWRCGIGHTATVNGRQWAVQLMKLPEHGPLQYAVMDGHLAGSK
jgi:hypothetical protein